MKKFGVLVFIAAVILGISISSFFSIGEAARPFFSFSFNKKAKGSGKIATEARDLRDFRGIDVSGVFQVEVIAGRDFSVEIEADDNLLPLIQTEVRGGVLHIDSDGRVSTEHGLKVRVTAPDISDIDASGVARVNVTELKNSELRIDTSGASKINVSGETSRLTIDVSGASNIDAQGLKSENAFVDASGASNVSVFVTGELRSEASGASKIAYSGSPQNVEKRTSGAGSVFQK